MDAFGKRLEAFINKENYKITDIVRDTGIARQSIYNYINGKAEPNISNFLILCNYFKINPLPLLGYESPSNTPISKIPVFKTADELNTMQASEYILDSYSHPNNSFWWTVSDNVMNGKFSEYHIFEPESIVLTYPLNDNLINGDYVLVKHKESNQISIRYYLAESGIELLRVGNNVFEALNGTRHNYDILGIIKQYRTQF